MLAELRNSCGFHGVLAAVFEARLVGVAVEETPGKSGPRYQ